MGVGGQGHAPAALPSVKVRHLLHRRRGGPQSRYGRVWNISPSPGFDPPTVEPVASRFTHYAIPAHVSVLNLRILKFVIRLHVAFNGL